jgi:hypothetical protein
MRSSREREESTEVIMREASVKTWRMSYQLMGRLGKNVSWTH